MLLFIVRLSMAQNQSKKAVINANVALLGFVPKSNRRFEVYFTEAPLKKVTFPTSQNYLDLRISTL